MSGNLHILGCVFIQCFFIFLACPSHPNNIKFFYYYRVKKIKNTCNLNFRYMYSEHGALDQVKNIGPTNCASLACRNSLQMYLINFLVNV